MNTPNSFGEDRHPDVIKSSHSTFNVCKSVNECLCIWIKINIFSPLADYTWWSINVSSTFTRMIWSKLLKVLFYILLFNAKLQYLHCWCIEDAAVWLHSLWPSDAIWQHRSGPILVQVMAWCLTLVQVMACCLTAPSHHLNQCQLLISGVLSRACEGNLN